VSNLFRTDALETAQVRNRMFAAGAFAADTFDAPTKKGRPKSALFVFP